MKPPSIAVIGAGLIGRSHIRILSELPPEQGRLAAIADPGPGAAELAASLKVPHFADARDMLDAVRPDGAVVATPNVLHGPNAIDCINRGVVPLVEKPLAEDVATANALAERAEAANLPILVGHFRR